MTDKMGLVKEWISKAEHDLQIAELALKNRPDLTDTICFHCQQTAEKYLKSYLVYLDIIFEKVHNLDYLLDLINEKQRIPDELYEMIEKLEDYAVEIRYPDDWYNPSLDESKEAYEIAKKVKKFVLNEVGFLYNSNN